MWPALSARTQKRVVAVIMPAMLEMDLVIELTRLPRKVISMHGVKSDLGVMMKPAVCRACAEVRMARSASAGDCAVTKTSSRYTCHVAPSPRSGEVTMPATNR